ncbi:hypothetical protein PanWU01x14_203800 [Parasponia andersonii]|uniref:Uncharacterized protein n=1 Tax=Parasponia andersonii TaxID=3476 RepID=A0A2P5BWW5_PARAD|nr:hypothetical protein PanWU01x14_203800 [Parasponia andersonii]
MKPMLGKTCFNVHQVVVCWPEHKGGAWMLTLFLWVQELGLQGYAWLWLAQLHPRLANVFKIRTKTCLTWQVLKLNLSSCNEL